MDNKKNILIGVASLLISAVLQAAFSCYLQNDWIVLLFTCVYAVIFLKYLKSEDSVNWFNSKVGSGKLKIAGMIILVIGLAFLPQSLGKYPDGRIEFIANMFSYTCWMSGLLLIDISKSTKEIARQ